MNNNLIITNREQKLNKLYNMMSAAVEQSLLPVTSYYNKVLERELDNRQTISLLNAQLAFIMTVFPVDSPIVLRLLCAAWLVKALLWCKKIL